MARIASCSNNLSGSFVKILREAATSIRIGADALSSRALKALFLHDRKQEKKVTRLRQEVRKLKEEIAKIREDKRIMLPPPIPTSSNLKRRIGGTPPANMEVEGEDPPPRRESLSPRSEWPLAIRPAMREGERIIGDVDEDVQPPGSPPRDCASPVKNADIEERLNARMIIFGATLRAEINHVLSEFVKKFSSVIPEKGKERADGAQKSVPTPYQREKAERLVPDGRGKGKGEKGKKSSPPLPPPQRSQPVRPGS